MSIQKDLVEMIANADRLGARRLVEEWGTEHGCENLLVEVLGPVLKQVGEMWQDEEVLSLAHAYVAARIVEDAVIMFEKAKAEEMAKPYVKGPVVLGNIEGDCHPLGRKIVATFLRADGWDVRDLGIDVEADLFVDEAIKIGARVIGVSAMIFTCAENIRRVRAVINARGLRGRMQLAVGGAVFCLRPELAEEIGGDGSAPDALRAPALFTRLWDRAVQEGGKSDE